MTDMYKTHYFTKNKVCPCKMDEDIIRETLEIFNNSNGIASFVEELERRRIKGKKIWYDPEKSTIFITKVYACEFGGGCPENDTLIGRACHCDHYNHAKGFFPNYYCQCGAEYYRPMFEPIFGKDIELFPYKTVLTGDDECIIGVKING